MSQLNAAQLAAFSVDVYDDAADLSRRLPPGFVRLSGLSGDAGIGGLYAAAYFNQATGELVISYRGSNELRDVFTNLSAVTSSGDTQFNRALAFVAEARAYAESLGGAPVLDSGVTLTGHGVGGGFAALVSVATGLQAVTFNGLRIGGLMSAMEERFGSLIATDFASRITSYVDTAEELYTLPRGTAQVGQVIDVQTSSLSFFGQLQAALGAQTLGNDVLDSVYDWLANDNEDRHRAQRLLMALELQFGGVEQVDAAGQTLADGSAAATEHNRAVVEQLNKLMQTDRADVIQSRAFDRLLVDGSDFGELQDTTAYGDSDDLMVGATGADQLVGGQGDDVLFGGDGTDILTGAAGDDYLLGGEGADIYRFAGGDGRDTLSDKQGANRIVVDGVPIAGFFIEQGSGQWGSVDGRLSLTSSGGYRLAGAGVDLALEGYSEGDYSTELLAAWRDPATSVEIRGDWDPDFPEDYLIGGVANERILAGEGDDYVQAGQGDDFVDGGGGDDYLRGDDSVSTGRDLLIGGQGSDVLRGDGGADRLYGTAVTDLAVAIAAGAGPGTADKGDWLAGGEGDDVLVGGVAGDVLTGGGGRDVLVGGAGNDWILADADYVAGSTYWTFSVDAEGRSNYFSPNQPELNDPLTSAADIVYAGSGDDWVTGGRGDDLLFGEDGRDTIRGDLGSDTIAGGADADVLSAGGRKAVDLADAGADYLLGGAGDDVLWGNAGDTVLDGGDGADTIYAGPGADLISGGNGNDQVFAQGQDVVFGDDGDDQINTFGTAAVVIHGGDGADQIGGDSGDDFLFGENGDDVLRGDEGDDLLDGGVGNDRYVVRATGGVDRIVDAGGIDVVEIQSIEGGDPDLQVARESIRLIADNSEVYLAYGAGGDRVRLGADPRGLIERIELKHLAGGTVTVENIDIASLPVEYVGTSDAEILFGVEGFRNRLSGGDGNDIVLGFALDDVLAGGGGRDLLRGGDGSDLYLVESGGGVDTIEDDGAAGTDVLSIGVAQSDARLGLAGGALLVGFGSGDGVQITGFDPLDALASTTIERIVFADGALSYQQLLARGFDLAGTDGADVISGTNLVDRFRAGRGNDRMIGGKGDDEYRFARGDGHDLVVDQDTTAGNRDRVVLTGISSSEIDVEAAGDRLSVKVRGTDDRLDIQWIPDSGFQVEELEFGDGERWDLDRLKSLFGAPNLAPGVNRPIGDQLASEDNAFLFKLDADTFVDPDTGDALALSATLESGDALPAWLRFDGATGTFSGTPANGDVGTVSVTVVATDGAGASASDTFDVAVINTNDAPELVQPIGRLTATEDSAFSFVIPGGTFRDVDAGDAISYLATLDRGVALPSWLHFDGASGTFSGTPTNDDVGGYRVHVLAVDGSKAIAEDVVDLVVENTNDAPALAAPLADRLVRAGDLLEFQIPAGTFVDPDKDDTLAFDATLADGTALPAWLAFDRTTGLFTGAPGQSDAGALTVRVTARDGDDVGVSDEFTIVVEAVPGMVVTGDNGDNVLVGDAGDDTLSGRRGADTLLAGDGDDTLVYSRDATWTGNLRRTNVGSPGVAGTGETATLNGRSRSFDLFDGGAGVDRLTGTGQGDAILLDDALSPLQPGTPRLTGVEIISAGDGSDLIDMTSTRFDYGDLLIDAGDGADIVWSGAGDDVIYGGRGNDRINAGAGDDYVAADGGSDDLNGGAGNDVVQGDAANDRLIDLYGNNVLDGRAGADDLFDGSGNAFLVGGRGADRITIDGGFDVLAFNRGDFRDVVRGSGSVTLSLGGGIAYQDLALRKSGADLIVDAGGGERLTFKEWYADPQSRLVKTLQVVAEAMQGYNPGADLLFGQKVKWFDFTEIVSAFDDARAANQNIGRWQMMGSLAAAHLGGSDTEAIGGDLAYQYGKAGVLAGMGLDAVQQVLGGTGFGAQRQTLGPLDQITSGDVKLS